MDAQGSDAINVEVGIQGDAVGIAEPADTQNGGVDGAGDDQVAGEGTSPPAVVDGGGNVQVNTPQWQQMADMMSMIRSVMEKYDKIVEENRELAKEVKLLRISAEAVPQVAEANETEVGSNAGSGKGLKGFDYKSNPKPKVYGLEQSQFQEWDELLKAMMVAIDDQLTETNTSWHVRTSSWQSEYLNN